jgi:hypothetical protein
MICLGVMVTGSSTCRRKTLNPIWNRLACLVTWRKDSSFVLTAPNPSICRTVARPGRNMILLRSGSSLMLGDKARQVVGDRVDAGCRSRTEFLAGQLARTQLPLWIQPHSDRRVAQETGIALDLRQELAAARLEVQDQQQLVPMGCRQVARDGRRVHRRAVGSLRPGIRRGNRGDELERRQHRLAELGVSAGLALHPLRIRIGIVGAAEDVRRADDAVVGHYPMTGKYRPPPARQLRRRLRARHVRGGLFRLTRAAAAAAAGGEKDHEHYAHHEAGGYAPEQRISPSPSSSLASPSVFASTREFPLTRSKIPRNLEIARAFNSTQASDDARALGAMRALAFRWTLAVRPALATTRRIVSPLIRAFPRHGGSLQKSYDGKAEPVPLLGFEPG